MAATTAFIQGNAAEGKRGRSAIGLDEVTEGNFLVLALSTAGAGGYADTPEGWVRAGHQILDTTGADLRQQVWVQTNVAGGTQSVTVDWPDVCHFILTILEFSGVYASSVNPLDVYSQAKGLSATVAVTGGTTNAADELWIGVASARNNDRIGAASGWTKASDLTSAGPSSPQKVSQAVYYQNASATAALSLSASIQTTASGRPWLLRVGSYPSTAAGAPGNIDAFTEMYPAFSVSGNLSGGTQVEPSNVVSNFRVTQAIARGSLWMSGGTGNLKRSVYYSSNGTTWTAYSYNTRLHGDIVALAGDKTYLWCWEHHPNSQRLLRLTAGTVTPDVYLRTKNSRFPLGMVVQGGNLYVWTGAQLYKYNATIRPKLLPLQGNPKGAVVHSTGTHPDGAFGGITATAASVVYFVAREGQTTLYEYKEVLTQTSTGPQLVGNPDVLWEMPLGFTAKGICHQQGSIMVLGEYNGKCALFALSPSLQTLFLGYIRPQSTLTARCIAAGQGNTVLIGCYDATTTYCFVYDIGTDAFSLLDSFAISSYGTIDDLSTYLLKRVGTLASSSTVRSVAWNDDTTSDTTLTGQIVFGAWDYNVPEQPKCLMGFNVLHSPGNGVKTFSIDYQIDESGSYTTGATQTPANGVTSTFVQIASSSLTVNLKQLRLRVNFTGLDIYSASALVTLSGYYETWELLLRIADAQPGFRLTDGSNPTAEKLRDNLFTARQNEAIVSFIDGCGHRQPKDAVTKDVRIEDVQDIIIRKAEGFAKVVLRAVTLH